MTKNFPIFRVEPDSVVEPEALGSKRKFWHRKEGSNELWLFKYAQENTGQHWAEKIAAELAAKLSIPHAVVELATFGDEVGSTTESFAREGRELYHGNQILAGVVTGYNPTITFRQSEHTLDNVFRALDRISARSGEGRLRFKTQMAEYIVFDALIGNTDRHHENWGVLRKRVGDTFRGFLAPSYDHASSLGRELLDRGTRKSRERLLTEGAIGRYAEGGRGGIYWEKSDAHGLCPLELVRRALTVFPVHFEPAVQKVCRLEMAAVTEIIGRVPGNLMSSLSRDFVREFVSYNLSILRNLAGEH